MENKILKFIKEDVLSTVKTTKDLVYKDKVIDPHDIAGSYKKMTGSPDSLFLESAITLGGLKYYINHLSFRKIDLFHRDISNTAAQSIRKVENGYKKMLQNFRESEIFNSLWIEGINSSKKKISQINKNYDLLSKDEEYTSKFINNYNDALHFVLTTKSFTESTFFSLYNILSKDIDMGNETLDGIPYRKDDVQIGDEKTKGADPVVIKDSMDSMFELVKLMDETPEDAAGIDMGMVRMLNVVLLHYHFELIHPYYDMNGRMGRLLSIWLANKWGLSEHALFLSEAINLFKHDLYYDAFKKSKFQNYKMDATYFISSISCALVSQKMIHIMLRDIHEKYKTTSKKKFSKLQKDIIKSLLSKDHIFYETRDFIIGHDDMNQATISISLSELVKAGILESTNTKPKQYKIVWTPQMDKILEVYKGKWAIISKAEFEY